MDSQLVYLARQNRDGGEIVNAFPVFNAFLALVPVVALETIAARPEVRSIVPAVEATTDTGGVTSEGDRTQRANTARTTFGADGTRLRVGVLSDGLECGGELRIGSRHSP